MTLTITGLSKRYERVLFSKLSLTVPDRTIVAVMGGSGTGKTTLLLCILGFVQPDSGRIMLDGNDIINTPVEQRQIGYVPQDYGLFPHLDVQGNIAFGAGVRGRSADIKKLLQLVGLPEAYASRAVSGLSGGEQQRVALARALAIEPRLFLFDEPLSSVDVQTRMAVARHLRRLIKKLGVPTIIVSHDPFVRSIADTTLVLHEGRLKAVSAQREKK